MSETLMIVGIELRGIKLHSLRQVGECGFKFTKPQLSMTSLQVEVSIVGRRFQGGGVGRDGLAVLPFRSFCLRELEGQRRIIGFRGESLVGGLDRTVAVRESVEFSA